MARGLDSDYIGSLSLMDGFDMGINFDGFGENMKKFMELPIKYLDSAHDKAVGLVEDIHALIYAPCPDNESSNKGLRTLMDPSSSNPIIGPAPTSVEMEQANPDEELPSSPSSLLTAEDSSLCSTDNCTSEDTISLERTAGTKEEIILCSAENLRDSCNPENCNSLVRTVSSEEEIILLNPGNSVKPPQPPEQATIVQDYVSQEANTERVIQQVGVHGSTSGHIESVIEQVGLHGSTSGHTESSASDGAILLGNITTNGEEQSGLYSANSLEESTKHDLQDGQERVKYEKAEASTIPRPKNISFKKVLMRSLSNKLRWSKKDRNVHQTVPIRPHKTVNANYEIVSSSDDLDDDWELL